MYEMSRLNFLIKKIQLMGLDMTRPITKRELALGLISLVKKTVRMLQAN